MTQLGIMNEQTSGIYTATLKDETGATVAGSVLSTLVMWLYEKSTKTIVNGRGTIGGAGQNVLGVNGVTVNESGLLIWTVQPEDTVIVKPTSEFETHVATFNATWGTDKSVTHEVEITVANLRALQ
jgi:hypothetical protein